jgi:hypothetical protein
MDFNLRKWLEDGFRRFCGGVRQKWDKKNMKMMKTEKKNKAIAMLPFSFR